MHLSSLQVSGPRLEPRNHQKDPEPLNRYVELI